MAVQTWTFADLKALLSDRNGVALDSAKAGRIVNQALDEVAMEANLPELRFAFTVSYTNGVSTVTLATDVRDVESVLDTNGLPLLKVDRAVWDDRYEGDATASGEPKAFCIYDANAAGTLIVKVWPAPNFTASRNAMGIRRVSILAADGDVPALPPELHHLVARRAVAIYREYEESELAPVTQQLSDTVSGHGVGTKGAGVIRNRI